MTPTTKDIKIPGLSRYQIPESGPYQETVGGHSCWTISLTDPPVKKALAAA